MEEINIRNIWKAEYGHQDKPVTYRLEDLRQFRRRQSRKAINSGKWIILFDLFYKGIISLAFIYLCISSNQGGDRLLAGFFSLIMAILILVEVSFLKRLPSAALNEPVMMHLKRHLIYLQTNYALFIFLSALSNLLFVLSGFMMYHHFKYKEIIMSGLLKDPVTYIFLAMAFGISYIAQKFTQKIQIQDIQESIVAIEETTSTQQILKDIRKRRKRNRMVGVLLIALGILCLLLILNS